MRISDTCFLNSVRIATGSALSCLASNSLMSESFLVTNSLISSRRVSIDSGPVDMTSPSFCTTVNERVYSTTSSDKGANGGSQGAVGDRRAAICGANASGAGGLYPSAECGRSVL